MITKTWTYHELTAAAETAIQSCMRLAAKAPMGSQVRGIHLCHAWGVFHGWASLTLGWQESGDSERLEALTNAVTL